MDGGTNQQEFEPQQARGCVVHWYIGHRWFRNLPAEQFRAALYQLHQREIATALQPYHVRAGTRRIPEGW